MATIYRQGDKGAVVKQIQKVVNAYPDGVWGAVTTECVKSWQKAHGLAPDGIAGPATLSLMGITKVSQAVTPSGKRDTMLHDGIVLKKSKRRIDYLVVHCTASREGQELTVEQIRKEHKAQGWSDIGYHYVVDLRGWLYLGRDVDITGSHVAGYNAHSIGIVYVGGVENKPGVAYEQLKAKDTRTDAQKASLISLLMDLRRLYPYAKILGHRDFPGVSKACPSFDAKKEYRSV